MAIKKKWMDSNKEENPGYYIEIKKMKMYIIQKKNEYIEIKKNRMDII